MSKFNSEAFASICNSIYTYDLDMDVFPELKGLVDQVIPEGEPQGYAGLSDAIKDCFSSRMDVRSSEYWHVGYDALSSARDRRDRADKRMQAFATDLKGDGLII